MPSTAVGAERVERLLSSMSETLLIDVLQFLIEKAPGRTESELAQAIYGAAGVQQHVNQDCRMLVRKGLIERHGAGGRADPYTYFPKVPRP